MIDYDTQLVAYDRLVKPAKPVVDYLTRWSGITAEALATATTTFSEAQAHVLSPVSSFTPKPNPFHIQKTTSTSSPSPPLTPILLKHSLESELKALKITHSFCVDAALIYSHPRVRPLKLVLTRVTKKWYGSETQIQGEGGHDPEEEARAMMELDDEEVVKNFVYVVEPRDFVFVRLMGLAGARGLTARANPSDGVPSDTTAPPSPVEPTPELLSSTLLEASTQVLTSKPSTPPRPAPPVLPYPYSPDTLTLVGCRSSIEERRRSVRKGLSVGQLSEGERWMAADEGYEKGGGTGKERVVVLGHERVDDPGDVWWSPMVSSFRFSPLYLKICHLRDRAC
ncbi:hypothetical protein BDP27DRAFT_1455301 [Rhodocollybia butyracea]|uniref:Uncharacterized protein n=1 Tax=Rhodocollybia butyracea TaxID=206335 RepID=A0A9P5P4S0_9AGAR|nr:hypothetical protein BDP27DRAFT_1455301 [Rhodocollybia butyracea]